MEADGLVIGETLGEVVALQHARYRHLGGEMHHTCEVELAQPLAVKPDDRLFPVQDPGQLCDIGFGIGLDLFRGEHGTRCGASGRIADQGGVVSDDDDDLMPKILELSQLAQHHGKAQMYVRGGRVQPELDFQRFAAARGTGKLLLQPVLRHDADGPALQPLRLRPDLRCYLLRFQTLRSPTVGRSRPTKCQIW